MASVVPHKVAACDKAGAESHKAETPRDMLPVDTELEDSPMAGALAFYWPVQSPDLQTTSQRKRASEAAWSHFHRAGTVGNSYALKLFDVEA